MSSVSQLRRVALMLLTLPMLHCVFDSMGVPHTQPPKPSRDAQQDAQLADGPLTDSPPPHEAGPDLPGVDGAVVDSLVAPDGGCPGGNTNCGGICVDLKTSLAHCGKCSKACAAGLNCQQGSCKCVAGAGSNCGGCCSSDKCIPLGAAQSKSSCGQRGQPCQACDDKKVCTLDSCTAKGTCTFGNAPSTTACDDKDKCTTNDKCNAGKCKGTAMDCAVFDTNCRTGVCNKTLFVCEGQNKLDTTACVGTFDCLTPGACWCKAGFCVKK